MPRCWPGARGDVADARKALDARDRRAGRAGPGSCARPRPSAGCPPSATQVDAIARAAAEFEDAARALHAERAALAQAEEDLAERTEAIERGTARIRRGARRPAQDGERLQAALEEEFRALEEALSADVQRVLAQIREAERGIIAAKRAYDELDARARAEHDKVIAAGTIPAQRARVARRRGARRCTSRRAGSASTRAPTCGR